MLEPKEEQDKMLVTRDKTTSGRTDLLSLKGVCKYAVRLVLSLLCGIDRKLENLLKTDIGHNLSGVK